MCCSELYPSRGSVYSKKHPHSIIIPAPAWTVTIWQEGSRNLCLFCRILIWYLHDAIGIEKHRNRLLFINSYVKNYNRCLLYFPLMTNAFLIVSCCERISFVNSIFLCAWICFVMLVTELTCNLSCCYLFIAESYACFSPFTSVVHHFVHVKNI